MTFSDKIKMEPESKKLFFLIPDEIENILLKIIENEGRIYINDEKDKTRRACTQALIKIYQDFKMIKLSVRLGYQTQASTIASSMMETTYFISYMAFNPSDVDKWLNHDEFKSSDSFYNWRSNTLSNLVKSGKMSKETRDQLEETEKYTYSILSSSKHNNGLSIRKTNVVMEEMGKPHLVPEPRLTPFSHLECAGAMATSNRIAATAIQFYIDLVSKDKNSSISSRLDRLQEASFGNYFAIQKYFPELAAPEE